MSDIRIINKRETHTKRDWFFLCGAWLIGRANRALMARLLYRASISIYREEMHGLDIRNDATIDQS